MSFEFLNEHQILLPVIERKGPNGGFAALYILDCTSMIPERTPFQEVPRIATFHLPKPRDEAYYTQLFVVTNPNGAIQDPSNDVPILHDPALRLLAFQLRVCGLSPWMVSLLTQNTNNTNDSVTDQSSLATGVEGEEDDDGDEEEEEDEVYDDDDEEEDDEYMYMYLFVHVGTLESHANRGVPGGDVRWEDWASRARLMRARGDTSIWLYDCVSHRRCLLTDRKPDADGHGTPIKLYDFPPPSFFRAPGMIASHVDGGDHGQWQHVVEQEVVKHVGIFPTEVVSGLPYRKIDTGYKTRGNGCYIVSDCLVGSTRPTLVLFNMTYVT